MSDEELLSAEADPRPEWRMDDECIEAFYAAETVVLRAPVTDVYRVRREAIAEGWAQVDVAARQHLPELIFHAGATIELLLLVVGLERLAPAEGLVSGTWAAHVARACAVELRAQGTPGTHALGALAEGVAEAAVTMVRAQDADGLVLGQLLARVARLTDDVALAAARRAA